MTSKSPETKEETFLRLQKRITALEGMVDLLRIDNIKLRGPKASIATSAENKVLRQKMKSIQRIVGKYGDIEIP